MPRDRLPIEALAAQLETVELVQSLFPGEDELVLDEQTAAFLPTLRDWIEAGDAGADHTTRHPDELALTIQLALDQQDDLTSFILPLSIRLSLLSPPTSRDPALSLPDGTPAATIRATQPSWMSRSAHDELSASLPAGGEAAFASNVDLLLATIDHIRSMTPSLLPIPDETPPASTTRKGAGSRGRKRPDADTAADEQEYRVWFWFPSLSTREKRDDMVNWAPEYELTGFVLAGKPALLCVEGTESNVQAYLSDIKANSWADIPSFQKKVSERFRTPLLPPSPDHPTSSSDDPTSHRLFTSMDEITSLIPRGGYRGHKPEMGDVRDFLTAKGLGEAFGQVVGGGQFS
ncbi:hypothetical protein JCM10908_001791 [Rhodotorula pacifica]|uniref:uncharacterized protein n=1 Tax=Rhodotorula pacifica TaxID=1495444 RepID=UPI00317B2ADA